MGKAMITAVLAESCCGDKFFAENIRQLLIASYGVAV
jgi:hypothetical protein